MPQQSLAVRRFLRIARETPVIVPRLSSTLAPAVPKVRSSMKPTSAAVDQLRHAINLRLSLLGCPQVNDGDANWIELTAPIFSRYREVTRRMADRPCPVDERIQRFLDSYLSDVGPAARLPARTFVLDQLGLARQLSLPADGDEFTSPLLKSYLIRNGVLHNPANDRRTTKGVFHIAEGGLPIPDDKLAVPKPVFARLLDFALRPPHEMLCLPYTANQPKEAEAMASLLIRPLVVPAVEGFGSAKRMEIRFFAPGSLVSNLDFIESVFGNAGDPYLPENDAALDIDGWCGHTGCVILAPHLVTLAIRALVDGGRVAEWRVYADNEPLRQKMRGVG